MFHRIKIERRDLIILVPLKLLPAMKDYIWGGTRLAKEFDLPAVGKRQAEAWLLSCHPDGENVIENGAFAGRTLSDVLRNEGKAYLGTHCDAFEDFPVLFKLIDAKQNLSVQVHPDDAYALEHEHQYGKTEAWYILDCDDGAELLLGFAQDVTKEEFRAAIAENRLPELVNHVKVKPGELYFIPSGTLHAICQGILLAEIQQNSNVTYRIYDYGRLQDDGTLRPLHVDRALDVTDRSATVPDGTPVGTPQKKDGFTETLLTSCERFTLRRLDVETEAALSVGPESFLSLVAIDGNGVLMHGDNVLTLYKGESIFLPANLGEVRILGKVSVLATTV